RVMEERDELLRIMSQDLETEGTAIRIGRENIFEELQECSIITSAYRVKDRISGNIGVIGPMRMRYEEVVPLVERLAEITTEILEEIPE
ncbi:MAG: HrcA family transcriptional regulator, partial [Candidatus Omnitrophota bacterium]